MRLDRSALLWGTIVAVTFVLVSVVVTFKFPHLRLPFTWDEGEIALMDGLVFWALFGSYSKIRRRPGFWAVLVAFVAANTLLFHWLLSEEIRGPKRFLVYGVAGAAEFFVFALIMLRLYRLGPDTRSWAGSARSGHEHPGGNHHEEG